MRIIYRTSDKVVFWIEPEQRILQDYLEPIWRDDITNTFHVQSGLVTSQWDQFSNNIITKGETPDDATEIILWRAKARALNQLARYIGLKRQTVVAPIIGQEQIYRWKVEEARQFKTIIGATPGKLLAAYALLNNLSTTDAANMILVRDEQYYSLMVETEEERLRFIKLILLADTLENVNGVNAAIHRLNGVV